MLNKGIGTNAIQSNCVISIVPWFCNWLLIQRYITGTGVEDQW